MRITIYPKTVLTFAMTIDRGMPRIITTGNAQPGLQFIRESAYSTDISSMAHS